MVANTVNVDIFACVNFRVRVLNQHVRGLLLSRTENIMVKNETTVTEQMSDLVITRVKVAVGNTSLPYVAVQNALYNAHAQLSNKLQLDPPWKNH